MMCSKRKGFETKEEMAVLNLVSDDGLVDARNAPELSTKSINCMPSELRHIFKTRKGKIIWAKMWAVLKYYLGDNPNNYMVVEQFNGLYSTHYKPPLKYMEDFGVHQNFLFASLQEWVDAKIDVFSNMRLHLRRSRLPEEALRSSKIMQTKIGKKEREFKMDQYSQLDFDDSGDELRDTSRNSPVLLPPPDPKQVQRSRFYEWMVERCGIRDEKEIEKKFQFMRRMMYDMLLEDYTHIGLIDEQVPKAVGLRYQYFGISLCYQDIVDFMQDVIKIHEKGTWRLVRIRLDVKGLYIDGDILKKKKLLGRYKAEQAKLLQAESGAPAEAHQPSTSQRPQVLARPPVAKIVPPTPAEQNALQSILESQPSVRLSGKCIQFDSVQGKGFIQSAGKKFMVRTSSVLLESEDSVCVMSATDQVEFELQTNESGENECVNVTGPDGVRLSALPYNYKPPRKTPPPVEVVQKKKTLTCSEETSFPMTGKCVEYNSETGFGSIQLDDRKMFRAHQSNVVDGSELQVNGVYEFQVRRKMDAQRCVNVRRIYPQQQVKKGPSVREQGTRTAVAAAASGLGKVTLNSVAAAELENVTADNNNDDDGLVVDLDPVVRNFCEQLALYPKNEVPLKNVKDMPGFESQERARAIQDFFLGKWNEKHQLLRFETTPLRYKLAKPQLFLK